MSTTIFQKDFTGIDAAAIVASMVGSGRNIDSVGIPIGAPVFEDASGNVRLASALYPAFAVAQTGAPKGGVVSYRTDGQVERADWSPITRTALLVVGATYFVSGTGGLDTTGLQQVGVAVSSTVLRVTIQATATVAATSFVLSNTNGVSFGTTGRTITASVFTNYLTGFNVSDGSTSSNVTGLVFSNTNGVSFGLSSNTLTASVATSLSNINVSAGATSQNLSKLVLSNSNGVSFGLNGSTVTASVATSLTNMNVSAGTTSNNLSAVTFSNSNGLAFGLNGSVLTGSYTVPTQSNQTVGLYASSNTTLTSSGTQDARSLSFRAIGSLTVGYSAGEVLLSAPNALTTAMQSNAVTLSNVNLSAGTTSNNLSAMVFSNSNNFSFGLSGSTITASYTVPTVPAQTNQTLGLYMSSNTTLTSSGTVDARSHTFRAIGSLTVGFSNGEVLLSAPNALTTAMQSNAATISNINVSAGANSNNLSAIVFSNSNNFSFGLSGSTVTASYTVPSVPAQTNQSIGIYASSNTTLTSSGTLDARSFSVRAIGSLTAGFSSGELLLSAPNAITTAMLSNAVTLSNIKLSAGTLSANRSDITFSDSNGVSWGLNTNGVVTASVQTNYLTTAMQSNAATISNINVSAGGTSNNLSAITFSNSNSITFGLSGSTMTASYAAPFVSSYENVGDGIGASQTQSAAPGSVSIAVAFFLPCPLSASFVRLPIALTTNSTTLSTAASSMNGSAQISSTWNAVVYSIGVGASSRSLQSVASGSVSWVMNNSISVAANGTQGSYTQAMSYAVEGVNTNTSTQYSISNSNYSFVTSNWQTNYSGSRFLDINFANSLSAGAYWLIFGLSTSSNSNSARCSAATNCNIAYASHYAVSQANLSFGIMGSTNLSSGAMVGAGSFSTAGGGTTANLPISAISSSSSHLRPYFQLLRSA